MQRLRFPPPPAVRPGLIPALLAALVASGCTVGPDYAAPTLADLKVPPQFEAGRTSGAPPPAVATTDPVRWWRRFDDPLLAYLVERAFISNLDIDAAGARLRQARAALRIARGSLWPAVGASASVSRSLGREGVSIAAGEPLLIGSSGDRTSFDAGIDASYEADLFGGIRRSVEASRADLASAQADLHATQLSIASEVALNYVDARLQQQRLRIARETLASQDETLQIVGWRVQAGLVSSLDLEQARQLRAQTAAGIPAIETAEALAKNRLAVLLGEAPAFVAELLARPGGIPSPPTVGSAIPAEVIQRRPDIGAAERSLAAETARIGIEESQLYPALQLLGSFGGSGFSAGDLVDEAAGNIVGSITAPIFQGGRIRGAIEAQRATAAAAFASFRQAVLVALGETENALVSVDTARRRESELAVAEQAAENAVLLARSQYRAGLIDFQALLESERVLLSSRDSRATARADRTTAAVQLFKALGGGWEAAPEPATVTTSALPSR